MNMLSSARPVPEGVVGRLASGVEPPPAPRTMAAMQLHPVMMRDVLLKTMFRMNVTMVSEIARAICLPIPVTQELVDLARSQKLCEAMGTLSAAAASEMAYQLTDAGKRRATRALAQSEYYGAMPVPLAAYREQVSASPSAPSP
jgi:hypothetical protein